MKGAIRLDELVRRWAEETGRDERDVCFALADLLEQQDALPQGFSWVANSLDRPIAGVDVTRDDLVGYFRSGGRGRYHLLPGSVTWHDVDQGRHVTKQPVVVRRPIELQASTPDDVAVSELDALTIRNNAAREAWGYGAYDEWRADKVWLSIARLVEALTDADTPVPTFLADAARQERGREYGKRGAQDRSLVRAAERERWREEGRKVIAETRNKRNAGNVSHVAREVIRRLRLDGEPGASLKTVSDAIRGLIPR